MEQHNTSINDSTASYYYSLAMEWWKLEYAHLVIIRVVSGIEIPVLILTLIGLCFIIKSRPAASVFVSNLILSDLIQVICILTVAANSLTLNPTLNLRLNLGVYLIGPYHCSLIVGVYFMACVAFERYLLVSHPIWYKSHQSLKLSCFISVIIWIVLLIFALLSFFYFFSVILVCIACLIPYIIIILCFAGTWRGLSHVISLTAFKRKLILGSLFLVLLTYTFIILPYVIIALIAESHYYSFVSLKSLYYARFLLYVNPLADCVLYLLIRPDVRNMMKSVCCCCRHQRWNHNQDEHSVVNPQSSCCTVVCCISAEKPASHSLNTCSSV